MVLNIFQHSSRRDIAISHEVLPMAHKSVPFLDPIMVVFLLVLLTTQQPGRLKEDAPIASCCSPTPGWTAACRTTPGARRWTWRTPRRRTTSPPRRCTPWRCERASEVSERATSHVSPSRVRGLQLWSRTCRPWDLKVHTDRFTEPIFPRTASCHVKGCGLRPGSHRPRSRSLIL